MLRLSAFMQPHDCFARGATAKQLAAAERRLGGPLPWQAQPLSLKPPLPYVVLTESGPC